MLEGKNVNLRVVEKDDVDYLVECINDIDFMGEYASSGGQITKSEQMKYFDNPSNLAILTEAKMFIVQKKDGTKIGLMNHRLARAKFKRALSAGCSISPVEIGKMVGLDVTDAHFWELGLKQYERFVEELEKIVS